MTESEALGAIAELLPHLPPDPSPERIVRAVRSLRDVAQILADNQRGADDEPLAAEPHLRVVPGLPGDPG